MKCIFNIHYQQDQTVCFKKNYILLLRILYQFYATKTLILKLVLLTNIRKNIYLKVPVVEMQVGMKIVHETNTVREESEKSESSSEVNFYKRTFKAMFNLCKHGFLAALTIIWNKWLHNKKTILIRIFIIIILFSKWSWKGYICSS